MGIQLSRFLGRVMALVCLGSLSFMMAACFGIGDVPSSSTQSSTQSTTSSSSFTVTITEKAGTHDIYNFAPQNITIKAGTVVKWVNNSDENHLLASDSAGAFSASSIVPRSGSSVNAYQVVFNAPGTYHY